MNNIIRHIKFAILRRLNKNIYEKSVKKQLLKEEQEEITRRLNSLKNEEKRSIYEEPVIKVINMNANDVCNSKCVMCRIWAQQKQHEITPEEVYKILSDPLYENVEHIGVTGGEPTLRDDLPQLYEAIFKALPNIKHVSSITNCINHEEVIKKYEQVLEVCKKYNKPFSMMISLDGIGQAHERVRRIKGNFNSAMIVLNHFKSRNIPIATGTTISKINVWDVDETLQFMVQNNIYGRFRIAEFINRLYNDDAKGIIRDFDKDETYQLLLFFHKLILWFERNEDYIRTYKSIINMLSGGSRLIGCPYKYEGTVLNSRGEIAYCAPKSKILGNALETSSLTLYKENLSEKGRILKQNCSDCIHDYHAPITYNEELTKINRVKWEKNLTLKNVMSEQADFSMIEPLIRHSRQVLITGWYGTETVGDKAILGQIIDEIRQRDGEDIHIIISAIHPFIVERTIDELCLNNCSVVDVYSDDFVAAAKGSYVTIMGGGPLMGIDELSIPLLAFKIAQKSKKKTVVYGCGLGPLIKDEHISAVKEILQIADEIKLRDFASVKLAKSWLTNSKIIEMSGDPAKKYVEKYKDLKEEQSNKKIIRCFLREWTSEYISCEKDFLKEKELFEIGIAKYIIRKVEELGADIVIFEHMHNFIVGGDDRDFSRYFIKKYLSDVDFEITYNKKLSTVTSVISAMKNSSLNICMRFHSVLFAHTLDTNFQAIDYTLGGKIKAYLEDNNVIDKIVTKDQLTKI